MRLPDRTKPLTPGLKDFMGAALQPIRSHVSERNSGNSNSGPNGQEPDGVGLVLQRNPHQRGLKFLSEDKDLEWDEQDAPRTPASTELNPAVW